MAVKKFNTRIQLKRDSASAFSSFTPLAGEFLWVTDQNNFKIGNANGDAFSSLNYVLPAFGNHFTGTTTNGLTTYQLAIDNSTIVYDPDTNMLKAVSQASPHALTIGTMSYDGGTDKTVTVGNGLAFDPASSAQNTVQINLVPENAGYITVGANGINVTNVDTDGTSTTETDLATVKTVTEHVSDAIEGLDVSSLAQAAITNGTGTSTLTINGISETDGKIATDSTTNKLDVAIDGEYSASSNKIATQSTVTSAVNGLNANTVATATKANAASGTGETVTITGVKETNGVIAQGEGTETFTIGDGALKLSGYGATDTTGQTPTIPTVAATDVFSANDTADSTIALGNEFVLDATNKTIGLRVKTAVSATNAIATEADIASLSGAMHYKGAMASDSDWPQTTVAGDTYVVNTGFTHSTITLEAGDMVVFDENGGYTVVQTNMTIGVADGQIAKNDGALNSGNIVVATANGVATSSYTPANIASHEISVTTSNEVATVSDTLTVGGTTQTAQTFSIAGGNKLTASASGNAITIDHDAITTPSSGTDTAKSQGQSVTAMTGITEDGYGHVTGYTTDTFTIPTVNDATLTLAGAASGPITVAGSKSGNAATFSANDGTANTITITHAAKPTTLTPAAVKVAVDDYGHAQTGDALTSSDIATVSGDPQDQGNTVSDSLKYLQSQITANTPGTLNTTNTTPQNTSASESLHGTVDLHQVAKTGTITDLYQGPAVNGNTDDLVIFDCGSASVNTNNVSA